MTFWTAEKIETLKAMHQDGHSYAAIGLVLGCSRNAAISKGHRLGFFEGDRGTHPSRARGNGYSPPAIAHEVSFKKPKLESLPKTPPKNEPKPSGPICDFPGPGKCKYIHGEVPGKDWRCCGAETGDPQSPWCQFHEAKCWSPSATRASRSRSDAVELARAAGIQRAFGG